MVLPTRHLGQRKQTASTTHKISQHKTLWVKEVRTAINNNQCCLAHAEMVVHSSQVVAENYQTRRVKYSQCQLKIQDLELHHRIWMVCWAQTHNKQNKIDQWVPSLKFTIINWEQMAPWDQVADQSQELIRFEPEDYLEELSRKGKSAAVKVRCNHNHPAINQLLLMRKLVLILSIKIEGLSDHTHQGRITMSLHRIKLQKLRRIPQTVMESLAPTILCLEITHRDLNRWSWLAINSRITKRNMVLNSIKSNQEARVPTTESSERCAAVKNFEL